MRGVIVLVLSLCLCSPAALAQTVIGTAIVEGRTVSIFDNGTWAYTEPLPPNCIQIAARLTFCPEQGRWSPRQPANADIAAAFSYDDQHFAQFILENIGARQGVNLNAMRQNTLQFAAVATGQRPQDIAVISATPTMVSGVPAETPVYTLKFQGIDVVYSNTYAIGTDLTVQIMTWAVTDQHTDQHKALTDEVLGATTVSFEVP